MANIRIPAEGSSLGDILDEFNRVYPDFAERILDE
jgi:hypothetical protein